MIGRRDRLKIISFFVLILAVDWFLYFRHVGHFFQGDTVFLINHRATTLAGYLSEFIELNPSGWYRPLTNELLESILYPFAGLNPIPYRIPVYVVFIGITVGVYAFTFALSRRHLAAALAAFFFTVHTTNAYTTYDLGFMPELLYAFFYIAATLAYFRYLQKASKAAYVLSLVCFVASLLSKEAAVTLPATLFLMAIIFGPSGQTFRTRLSGAIRSTAPHVLVMFVYLAWVVGYLQIQGMSISTLFDVSYVPAPGDYTPVLSEGALKNADLALSWAFNVPRGPWGHFQARHPAMVAYLKLFRVLVFVLLAVSLIRSDRNLILFGFAWFWITLLPALPLVAHFLPYYLFLPVIGLSLVVGLVFAEVHDRLRRFQPVLAAAIIVVVFGSVLVVTSRSIEGDIRSNSLLGGSASIASNTLSDLKRLYPVLPATTTIFFADANEPVAWHHDYGGLIRMAYATKEISVLYESLGDSLFPEVEKVLVFEFRDGRLTDATEHYRSKPGRYMKFADSDLKLELSAREVRAGQDKYTLTVSELRSQPVRIAYTLNDGGLEVFTAVLDANGRITLDVSRQTRKGVYRFWGFKSVDAEEWNRSEQILTVR